MNILFWKIIIKECCNMLMNLSITSWKEHTHCIIRFFSKIMISSQSVYQIRIKTDKFFSEDRDLVFHSIYSEIYDHIVDMNMIFIYVQNDKSINIIISQHICLSNVAKYKEESCYTVSIENIDLAVYKLSIKLIVKMFEICLFNEITIYNNKINEVAVLTAVMKTYSDLWHNHDRIVNISESDYLQISLKKNWIKKVTKLSKQVYLLSDEAWKLVNSKFDELYCQKWMNWSIQSTSFDFSVFIVWKMIISESISKQKNCVIIDICDLNWMSQLDFYSLSLQTDITAAVWKCHYIFTVNCASFFYQWLVNSAN